MTFNFETGKYDPFINYSLGAFMIICVLISTLLNPLICYSYTKKRKTIQNFLFKVIAVSDFITTLIPGIFISYVFLSDMKFAYTFKNQIPEFLSCTFGCISQVTTTMMAATRMISIIQPFLRVKFKFVLTYLVFYAVYMAIGNAGSLVITGMKDARNVTEEKQYGGNHMGTLETLNKFICFVMNMIHCVLGVLCSFIAVGYLRIIIGASPEQARKLRSLNTILIMNIPYIFSIVSNFLAFYQVLKIDFKLVNHYIIPILTSAFNPCVIMARTNVIQDIRSGKQVNVTTMATTATAVLSRRFVLKKLDRDKIEMPEQELEPKSEDCPDLGTLETLEE